MLRIKLVKSTVAHHWRIRATVQALGLRKISQVVEHEDNPSIRGQVHHVKELLLVEDTTTGQIIFDGRTTRKKATRKERKPSEKRGGGRGVCRT
jgi:large subunit ribosomal protein L30